MPHTSGTVTYFADRSGGGGTLGLLGELLGWLSTVGYTETIGTGDGATAIFSNTLANTPIAPGQARVRYKIGGVIYETWEDGAGVFEGDKITTGTLNKATGDIDFTFSEYIDDLYDIDCLYTDAATEGQDWLQVYQDLSQDNAGADEYSGQLLQEVVLRNSGVGYKDNVFVGAREWQDVGNSRWGINLNIYEKFDTVYEAAVAPWNANSSKTGKTTYSATGNWSTHPSIYLKDEETIAYWFIANKRRIIVIARTASTLYMSMYIGFGKRIATPEEYSHPGIILGNQVGDLNFATASLVDITNIGASPYNGLAITPENNYIYAVSGLSAGWIFADSGMVKKSTNDKITLQPCYLRSTEQANPNGKLLFELDGIYKILCDSVVAEDTITIGGDTYLVVPNIYRSNYYDYFAVKLE